MLKKQADKIKKVTTELWWAVVASGLVGIIFGLVAIIWPHITLTTFIYLFSFFVIVVSVIVLAQALTNIKIDPLWWLSMLFGLCGISIGIFTLSNPGVAQAFLAVLLAVFIFTQSLLDLIVASYARDSRDKLPMISIGIIGIVFGFCVLMQPKLATEAMVWVIGFYILAHGIAAEVYAFRVRAAVNSIASATSSDSGKKTKTKTKTKAKNKQADK